MAEREALQKQYAYSEMSNKVVQRSGRSGGGGQFRDDGGSSRGIGGAGDHGGATMSTGEVESRLGNICTIV